jgi:DNA-binding GntR family transcriptional regulator
MVKLTSAPKLIDSGKPKRTPKVRLQLKSAGRVAKQQSQLLHERAADTMRNMIIEGEILPGSRMPEMELSAMLGVSRTPLREAFKVLAAEGLLILTPQRGAMVTEPDVEELDATVEAVAHVEASAARIACRKASDEEIAEIVMYHKQMADAAATGNFKRYFRANQDFHVAIVKASHNEVLIGMHTRANAHLMRHRYQTIDHISESLRNSFIEQHGEIVEALLARDPAAVDQAVLSHLGKVGDAASDRPRLA